MEVSPHFLQGVDVYVLCVCVYAHTHTLHVGYSDVSPGVETRHLESPEEIQMYCSDSIHIYRAVYNLPTEIVNKNMERFNLHLQPPMF